MFFNPIDGADAGFDPIDHMEVDSRLGTWEDVRTLSEDFELTADLIVNHISSKSLQFRDYYRKGPDSQFAGMFLTYDRVFPLGGSHEPTRMRRKAYYRRTGHLTRADQP